MPDEYAMLGVESKGTRINARAYMIAQDGRVLKACVIAGPEQTCVGIFANLVTEGAHCYVDGYYTSRCEFRYRRLIYPLPCKWVAMLILSKDPRCVWNDSDAGVIAGIKRATDTPFLEGWIGFLRRKMEAAKYLVKLTGHKPRGSMVDCSSESLDELVVQGLKSRCLKLE